MVRRSMLVILLTVLLAGLAAVPAQAAQWAKRDAAGKPPRGDIHRVWVSNSGRYLSVTTQVPRGSAGSYRVVLRIDPDKSGGPRYVFKDGTPGQLYRVARGQRTKVDCTFIREREIDRRFWDEVVAIPHGCMKKAATKHRVKVITTKPNGERLDWVKGITSPRWSPSIQRG